MKLCFLNILPIQLDETPVAWRYVPAGVTVWLEIGGWCVAGHKGIYEPLFYAEEDGVSELDLDDEALVWRAAI